MSSPQPSPRQASPLQASPRQASPREATATSPLDRGANAEPERGIVTSIARRAAYASPLWVVAAGFIWGLDGAASAAVGVALVLGNLAAAAAIITVSARISPAALMGATLGGFIVRLGLLTVAVLGFAQLSIFEPWPLAISIGVGHLGLLAVESRYLSLALTTPGSPGPAAGHRAARRPNAATSQEHQ